MEPPTSRKSNTFTALCRSGRSFTSSQPLWAVSLIVSSRVELVGRARAGEAAQAPERDAHVADAEFDRVVEILEVAPVPDLNRPEVAVLVLADPDALGIVAIGAVGRGAGGADPFRAAPGGGPSAPRAVSSASPAACPQPMDSICCFSSSVRYFSAILRSHSSGISAASRPWPSVSIPLNTWPKTRSNLSRLRSSFTSVARER